MILYSRGLPIIDLVYFLLSCNFHDVDEGAIPVLLGGHHLIRQPSLTQMRLVTQILPTVLLLLLLRILCILLADVNGQLVFLRLLFRSDGILLALLTARVAALGRSFLAREADVAPTLIEALIDLSLLLFLAFVGHDYLRLLLLSTRVLRATHIVAVVLTVP